MKKIVKKGAFSKSGNFVNTKGEILGKHNVITGYTIGQRRGLALNLNFLVFVAEIRPDANNIILGKYKELYHSKVFVINFQYIDIERNNTYIVFHIKIRYRRHLTSCRINIFDELSAEVELLNSEAMIANGQTAVFHDATDYWVEVLLSHKNRLIRGSVFVICLQ